MRALPRLSAALLATTLLLTGCAGTSSTVGSASDADHAWHGREPQPVPERPDFVLTDTSGRAFDFRAETAGQPTYVYFGYTSCPDECPTAMADIAAALRRSAPEVREQVRVVFVTTDPERDTPARMRTWLDTYGSGVVGLVGTQEELDAAQRAAGATPATRSAPRTESDPAAASAPAAEGDAGPLGYAVDHSGMIFAYDTTDRLPVMYPPGVTPADLAADLPRLADPTT